MQQVRYFDYLSELEKHLSDYIQPFDKVVFLVDSNTKSLCFDRINRSHFSVIEIPAGEEYKHINSLIHIWNELQNLHANRNTLLVALGGGVVTDITGFIASTYMRGISCLYIPTTLIAMVDAAHGGKTGIDFNGIKNLIGSFNFQPYVLICTEWLQTLPERELKSGLAEVIKHYLICDADSFYAFCQNPLKVVYLELIQKAVSIKNHFVAKDPKDEHERKALNFGHTIGHGIESAFLGTKIKLLHGEAVAIGMFCESYISFKRDLISENDLKSIENCLLANFSLPAIVSFDEVLKFVKHDKKNTDSINCVLLNGIGAYSLNQQISEDDIVSSTEYYNGLLQ